MKAMKINLKSYDIEGIDTQGKEVRVPYNVRGSIGDIILAPQLKLNGTMLLRNQKIAQKVIDCKEEFILLENWEYSIIKEATEIINVFSKNDVDFIRRIHESEEVEVQEK